MVLALVCGQITVIFAQPINFKLLANETIYNAWQGQLYHLGGMPYYEIKVSYTFIIHFDRKKPIIIYLMTNPN